MYNFTQGLIVDAQRIRNVLDFEPAVRPDFSEAKITTVVALIYCLIWKGIADSAGINRYLAEHGCRFDRDVIDFLISAYEGDDPERHLWTRTSIGIYVPIFDVVGDSVPSHAGRGPDWLDDLDL